MLDVISKGFGKAQNLLKKQTILTESNIDDALKEVRLSLLEADVEFGVVKSFINRVKERALGKTVKTAVTDTKGQKHKLSPYEHFVGICYEELESLMGPEASDLSFPQAITSFMMVGLQGSGKTTSSAKLAKFLKEEHKKKPLLVAADIYRPGAAEQLMLLGQRLNVPVFHLDKSSPQEICQKGLEEAKKLGCNTVIFDTAGRLAIDEKLMRELLDIKNLTHPSHIFMVVDAMIGQDAVNTARSFDEKLDLSGFILTKLDGDARGGAALSIKEITKKPIRFLGLGEDLKSLEIFRPQGLASRILGMGDIVSLAKDFDKHVDEQEAEQDMKRMLRGSFSFDDFLKQLNMMRKVGSFQSIIDRMPGMRNMLPEGVKVDDRDFIKFESMIFSMTKEERRFPELFNKQKTRRTRVAQGAGRKVGELDQLLERFMMMRTLLAGVGKNPNMLGNMSMFKDMNRMASIAKNYGSAPKDLMSLMGNQGMPFGAQTNASMLTKPKIATKTKKDKRKQQKLARKKSKKR